MLGLSYGSSDEEDIEVKTVKLQSMRNRSLLKSKDLDFPRPNRARRKGTKQE